MAAALLRISAHPVHETGSARAFAGSGQDGKPQLKAASRQSPMMAMTA
jgi:hypothetical protein